ncbi:putative conjugal transfer proteinc [mine drainage metagenome]|uniref:Putative conjugal transfer proteinc n=1 Tax=mine drainage metagenome TaxID=410659 RepID=A0A1J5RSP6_9ZZZZ
MLEIEIIAADQSRHVVQAPDECVVGKSAQNEISLDSWRVAKEHARIFRTPSGVLVEEMGAFGGVSVNGQRIDAQYGPLQASDVIGIGPFKLRVTALAAAIPEAQALSPGTLSDTGSSRPPGVGGEAVVPVLSPQMPPAAGAVQNQDLPRREVEFEWRKRIHSKLLETMDLRRRDISTMSDEHLRSETESLIRQILQEQKAEIPAALEHDLLCKQVLDEAIGLGPLEELLEDESVSEIMVNRCDEIYIERKGVLLKHPLTFTSDRAVMGVIERIVAPLGRRIDESSPMVDARLRDGSRVNAIIPPLALKGPALTIRKFARHKLGAEDLVRIGSISRSMAEFLRVCVESRKNIIVSGGTGSGKTTLLNILSNFIPPSERVITVEDAAELKLHHEHLISLESRPANVEGKGAIHIRDLVKNTLRMRPDRIVVGECRGAEALDMLQAMNTGHEGSLTTLHANSPRDGLARLETMVLMAGMDLPLVAIREQVAAAVDLIVQQTRFSCGARIVTSITEITGMESGKIQMQELFKFTGKAYDPTSGRIKGYFTGCDMAPRFYEELLAAGNVLDMAIFKPTAGDASRTGESADLDLGREP